MRKTLLFTAALVVASMAVGHADTLHALPATCAGSTGLTGVAAGNPSLAGVCWDSFNVAEQTAVTMTLTPDKAFTGTIAMEITRADGTGAVAPVTALYVNGQPLLGEASHGATLTPGDWKMTITAGKPMSLTNPYQLPGTPGHTPAVGAALGNFSGSVTVGAPVPATGP